MANDHGLEYPLFNEAAKITDQTVEMIRAKVPDSTKLLTFTADKYKNYHETFETIFEKHQIPFHAHSIELIQNAIDNSVEVRSEDGWHWNERGDELVTEGLIEVLKPLTQK